MGFGDNLRKSREYRRLTIAQLAKLSEVDYNTIYRTEMGIHKGRMKIEDAVKLAKALVTTVEALATTCHESDARSSP